MNTRLTRFATAGELLDHYTDKLQSATEQIAEMIQRVSNARLDVDNVPDTALIDYCKQIGTLQQDAERFKRNVHFYASFAPDDIPEIPF